MYQPTGFIDSANIVIINDSPYYRYNGSSYKDKLKNGLSLDYVLDLQNSVPIEDDERVEEVKPDDNNNINVEFKDYEDNYGFYEQKEFQTMGLVKKGKYLPFKKRKARNMKKNNNKIKGYEYKLFNIEQGLPNLVYENQTETLQEDDVNGDECSSSVSYDSYDENYYAYGSYWSEYDDYDYYDDYNYDYD